MSRDHTLYFGQSAEAFTILGRFEMQPGHLAFWFETWPSIAAFDAGDEPVGRLRQGFWPDAAERLAYAETLAAIELRLMEILDVAGRNWTLVNFYISTVDKAVHIAATSPAGDEVSNRSFSGTAYDELIADNQELVVQAVTLAWTYAKQHDAYLASVASV